MKRDELDQSGYAEGYKRVRVPARIEAIRYRLQAGYPAQIGRGTKLSQAKADVAALLAEVENLQRAVGGFLASVPALGIQTPRPANDNPGERGTDDEGYEEGVPDVRRADNRSDRGRGDGTGRKAG